MTQKSPHNNLSAIVLAAGHSGRMFPENKLLLPYRGKTIVQTVLDEIVPLNFTEILVVTGFEEKKIRETLQDYPVRFIYNPDYAKGMAASIKAGILEAKSTVDGYMIFLGDMPWIDQNVIKIQIQSFYSKSQSAIVVPAFQKRRGNPVIFARKYKNDLTGLTRESGARPVVEKFEDQVIEVQTKSERLLFDIDTWEDYEN